jgi:predicted MFS family arabinose efflux permease
MIDRNLARGIFLVCISLLFGVTAVLNYPIGDFARGGPGLFPTIVSCMLLLVGLATVIRSRFTDKVALTFNYKNIGLILGSLCAFAIVSEFVNMTVGIIAMVFLSTLAGTNYSPLRNLKIAAGLVAVAFIFAKFLGLNLPLY